MPTDWLTAGFSAEGGEQVVAGGPTASLKLARLGEMNLEAWTSRRKDGMRGTAFYGVYTFTSSWLNLGATAQYFDKRFANLFLEPGGSSTPEFYQASAGVPVLRTGSVDYTWDLRRTSAGGFGFTTPDGKARFNVAEYRMPVDDISEEYPIFLTTGRVVSQFLSGTQTRRIGPLVDQYPEPRIEIHPRLAEKLGIKDGDWTTAETRRASITLKAMVVTTIRPDTIFIPYHWPGRKAANQLTVAAQDPISKIPQYKVCGCRVRKADGPPDYVTQLEPQQ